MDSGWWSFQRTIGDQVISQPIGQQARSQSESSIPVRAHKLCFPGAAENCKLSNSPFFLCNLPFNWCFEVSDELGNFSRAKKGCLLSLPSEILPLWTLSGALESIWSELCSQPVKQLPRGLPVAPLSSKQFKWTLGLNPTCCPLASYGSVLKVVSLAVFAKFRRIHRRLKMGELTNKNHFFWKFWEHFFGFTWLKFSVELDREICEGFYVARHRLEYSAVPQVWFSRNRVLDQLDSGIS